MSDHAQQLRQLILSGQNEKNRTLANFAKIVSLMEQIDPRAKPKDILTTIVHYCFRYRADHLPSELEDLSQAPIINRLFNYPKDNPNKLINQQLPVNPQLRQIIDTLRYDLKKWKLVHHPQGKLVNIDHSFAALDNYIRSGRAKAELYSFGGDILKKVKNLFTNDQRGKSQSQLRQERGSLSQDDWTGDILGETLILVYKEQKDQLGPNVKLSDVLTRTVQIFKKPASSQSPTRSPFLPLPASPLPSPFILPTIRKIPNKAIQPSPIQKQQEAARNRQRQLLQSLHDRARIRLGILPTDRNQRSTSGKLSTQARIGNPPPHSINEFRNRLQ